MPMQSPLKTLAALPHYTPAGTAGRHDIVCDLFHDVFHVLLLISLLSAHIFRLLCSGLRVVVVVSWWTDLDAVVDVADRRL